MKYLFATNLLFIMVLAGYAQKFDSIGIPASNHNKVENLSLPSDFVVKPEEGFTVIKAECKGTVKWLVLCHKPVKYIAIDTTNTLILGIPPSGSVNVFAVGLCDGKLTEFAKTIITVQGKPDEIQPFKLPPKW